ncbi:Cerebellar degeneration-related protein 2 [Bagarius yarrelli]|uniref:Cerebellar degeneration-related protein 2 n=1 Tax=Bagarius yarrelli TaxID=175774 RepID=A0A556TIL9_BAGYA|nr:Cerebellar degeneration-related protein 2 [Bagarius yarrelli]
MLPDLKAEQDSEIKEEEQWCDHRDLEQDLHLAAKLGKTLLERNHELEEALQQMYTTNQEQIQKIEHLSKQVEMLRSVNDQHAKVYEQLDATARDLEKKNQRLTLENRSALHKIEGLTDTKNMLQAQVEELNQKIENMTSDPLEPEKSSISPSTKFPPNEHSESVSFPSVEEDEQQEEERAALLHSLQAQLNFERALRQTAEQEAEALAREISELEPHAALSEGYKARLAEVEAEVEELRQLSRSDSTSRMLQGTLFFPSEEDISEMWETKHRNSERQVPEAGSDDEDMENEGHNNEHRGCSEILDMSLLNEVDDRYNALQRKYNTLLHLCENRSQLQCDKAVQTSTNPCSQDCTQVPEYKMLFNEIFTYIQNSKQDLEMNRDTAN